MSETEVQPTSSTPEIKTEPTPVEQKPVEKPAEVKPVEEPKPSETKPEEKPAELKLTLAEGSKLDQSAVDETLKLAKEKGWSQEFAQSYLDAKNSAIQSYAEKQANHLAELNDVTWKNELMSDKEIGGQKFEESGILASKAILKFGGQEFHDFLLKEKLNHHPGLFKFAVNVAKAMADDQVVHPGAKSEDSNLPIEQRMYPDMYNKT